MELKINNIYLGDCLELIKYIPNESIDLILCDPPYGTTALKWDNIIDFDLLWKQYERVIKSNGTIVLFGKEPFSTKLRNSNLNLYKYDYVWIKNNSAGFMHSKNKPRTAFENIMVFSKGKVKHKSQDLTNERMTYNPQNLKPYNKKCSRIRNDKEGFHQYARPSQPDYVIQEYTNYPSDILEFKCELALHPTQKPVDLLKYLIRTHSNENELILDNCMGSGSTIVAAIDTNRRFIGIEKEEKYFNIAKNRINEVKINF